MSPTGIIKNPFGSGGFTCIDVSHYADVSGIFQVFIHFSVISAIQFLLKPD